MGLGSSRKRNILYLFLLAIAAVFIVASGCDGLRSEQAGNGPENAKKKADAGESVEPGLEDIPGIRDVEPTTDTAAFYKAVKGANKVVIIAGDMGDPLEDREQVPLNAFDSHEIEFWHIMKAVTSAIAGEESLEQESDYVIRWYDKYKKLGEAKINKDSGLTGLRYVASAGGKLESESNIISGNVYLPKENLAVVKDTANALLSQREIELEKAKKGTSRAREI